MTYGREEHQAWLKLRAEVTPREKRIHVEESERAAVLLDGLTTQARRRMNVLQVRCRTGGCRLGEVFRFPLEGSSERFLFIGITSVGRRRARFLNWGFTDGWSGPPVWFPAGCHHGHGKLERAWLLDLVGLVRGWHHAMRSVEEERSLAPEELQRGIARRVFHPQTEYWQSK